MPAVRLTPSTVCNPESVRLEIATTSTLGLLRGTWPNATVSIQRPTLPPSGSTTSVPLCVVVSLRYQRNSPTPSTKA